MSWGGEEPTQHVLMHGLLLWEKTGIQISFDTFGKLLEHVSEFFLLGVGSTGVLTNQLTSKALRAAPEGTGSLPCLVGSKAQLCPADDRILRESSRCLQ